MSRDRPGCGVTASQGMLVHEAVLAGESAPRRAVWRPGSAPVSAVTQLVDGLVEADILERRGDPDDRRRTRIDLTPHGRELYALFDAARLARAETLFKDLDDDQVLALVELLSKATHER